MPNGSAADLLECGARSLDWRPYVKEGKLVAHHGGIVVDHAFEDSLDEILGWVNRHPQELVLMHIWDCGSDGSADCHALVNEALSAKKLRAVTDCNEMHNVSVGEAKKMGALPSGGSLLPIVPARGRDVGEGCSKSNYNEKIRCWGPLSVAKNSDSDNRETASVSTNASATAGDVKGLFTYCCWDKSASKETPIKHMTDYMRDAWMYSNNYPQPFWQIQALWQENVGSVVFGEMHSSSLINDESKSKLNHLTASYIESGKFKYLNYVEVNNVCDGGNRLHDALTAFNSRHENALETE